MKRLLCLGSLLAPLFLLPGCRAFRSLDSTLKSAQGRAYELLVVCEQEEWNGAVGDSLRALFTEPVPYLNQTEPHFDVIRVRANDYAASDMFVNHRNILKVLAEGSVKEASASVRYDATAQPQIVVTLQGPDDAALIDYLAAHGQTLVEAFEQSERDRAVRSAEQFGNPGIESVVKSTFGMEMHVPKGYTLAKQDGDFIWARYEYPAASQGFMVYSYPYAGKQSLTAEALTAARNSFAARIPGPSKGSYMTTSEAFEPDLRIFRVDGRIWFELRGFWDVAGDFMGGPFVSYSTVDAATNRIVTFDGYIYSPKQHKRNYMRGVEHLFHTISFPDDEAK